MGLDLGHHLEHSAAADPPPGCAHLDPPPERVASLHPQLDVMDPPLWRVAGLDPPHGESWWPGSATEEGGRH